MAKFPAEMRLALNKTVHEAQRDGLIFEAYEAAIRIREGFPDVAVTTDELVDYMIARLGSNQPVMISPPAVTIELVISPEAGS